MRKFKKGDFVRVKGSTTKFEVFSVSESPEGSQRVYDESRVTYFYASQLTHLSPRASLTIAKRKLEETRSTLASNNRFDNARDMRAKEQNALLKKLNAELEVLKAWARTQSKQANEELSAELRKNKSAVTFMDSAEPTITAVDSAEPNMIKHPPHYTQGGVEVIDIIRDAVKGAEPFEAVALANCIKYLLRYKHKNGTQDLQKCKQYLEWLIEETEHVELEWLIEETERVEREEAAHDED